MCTARPALPSARSFARTLLPAATAVLLVLGLAPPAAAGQESVSEIAAHLREASVYVDDDHRDELPTARQHALEERIERSGINLKIVLVRLDRKDRWNGDVEQFTGALRDRLDLAEREHLILLTSDSWYGESIRGFEWPDDRRYDAMYAAMAVSVRSNAEDIPLADQLDRALRIIEDGTGEEEYRKAREDHPFDLDRGTPGEVWWLVGLGALGSAAVAGVILVRRRRRQNGKPYALRSHVFVAAREAEEGAVRRRAQQEVLRLGEELRAHQSSADGHTDPAPLQRALDAYDAAGRVLDAAVGLPDLVGVLALVGEGDDALAEDDRARANGGRKPRTRPRPASLPLCFFHPLHGRATTRVHWRALGRREVLHVATCRECAHAVKHRRAPRTLTERHHGREVPYFEVPAEQSLWTATGYGSFGDEPLATRVQRGDFTRAAEARAAAGAD